jgi:hypothetical protein
LPGIADTRQPQLKAPPAGALQAGMGFLVQVEPLGNVPVLRRLAGIAVRLVRSHFLLKIFEGGKFAGVDWFQPFAGYEGTGTGVSAYWKGQYWM